MPAPRGSTARALADLTIGVAKSMQARTERVAEVALQETTQQYQLAIEGTATTTIAWSSVDLLLDYECYAAPGQRDSDLERPQFYFGADVAPEDEDAAAAAPVGVLAVVTRWVTNESNGATVGARVAIGVVSNVSVPFSGVAHLSFQGFTALNPVEDDFPDMLD
jgi:hypothetical protein